MKVAVLVSGGVDSSLALRLLHEQGHEVTAYYLKIWLEDEVAFLGECPWEEDLKYIEALCEQLNVPLKVVSMQKEYWEHVVGYTISQVKAGKTPNPDVLCNKRIKFGAFCDKIGKNYDKIATGHYARVEHGPRGSILKMTNDPIKDQTYFLGHLSQDQLNKALFPIGHLTKAEVRELAERYDLPSKNRKDSQGICFLGKIKFKDFIRHHVGIKYGDIVEFETGKRLGEHEGFWYHTIGQRKGLGLSGGPWYVVSKDTDKNIVYVSNCLQLDSADPGFNSEKMAFRGLDCSCNVNSDRFSVGQFSWISGKAPQKRDLQVKIRHGSELYQAKFDLQGDSGTVVLNKQDQGIAPGQFAVFYDQGVCIGCGVIQG